MKSRRQPILRITAGLLGLGMMLALGGCDKLEPFVNAARKVLDQDAEKSGDPNLVAIPAEEIPPPPEPVPMEPEVNKEARVTVLGYHDFTDGRSTNDMVINVEDFRKQMQAIKDAKLPVISMRQFLDWKQGKQNIEDQSVVITIDDGWLATHSLALDVFKEFNYPFTVFLYKNYIGIGGRSMTPEQIREIAAHGGTLGSHSVSHQNMSARSGRSPEAYEAWVRSELEDSYQYLEEHFGDTGMVIKAFAFPFGIYNDQVLRLARELDYEACFTVNGAKTTWETDDMQIGRYVVHGTTMANFEPALSFGGGNATLSGRRLMSETQNELGETESALVTVEPPDTSTIGNRLPLLTADLSKLDGVVPESISMQVTGFGTVPHTYNAETGLVSYQVPQRLRLPSCQVQLSLRHGSNAEVERMVWSFNIDRTEDYLSSKTTRPGPSAVLKKDDDSLEPTVEEGTETESSSNSAPAPDDSATPSDPTVAPASGC